MTLKELNATIRSNIKYFTKVKEKVRAKFLINAVSGLLKAQSIRTADIARALESDSKTTARHIFKRLDRNLGQWDLEDVKGRAQARQAALIDNNTFIYFDPTDVVKKYGKKFESLGWVADGSDERKTKRGYIANVAVALKENELIPMELNLFSYSQEGFESQNQEVIHSLESIIHRTKQKGILVLDREFDGFFIIRRLNLLSADFIIRMTEKRHYCLSPEVRKLIEKPRQFYPRHEIINRFSTVKTKALLDIRKKRKLTKVLFTIKSTPVELTQKIGSPRTLTLIRAKASDTLTLYLLTNLQDINKESIVHIVQAYLDRWKVEEFIRFIKQQYQAERFNVRSLGKIKNLFHLLFISLVILTRTSQLDFKFSKARAIIIKHSKRVFKIPQKMKFFLYTLAEGLSQLLKKLTKSLTQLWTTPPKHQLKLDFGKLS